MESESTSEGRSNTEILVRVLATYLFALANYGHYGSLINLPSGLHVGYVVIFFFYPTIIIGQLVFGIVEAIKYRLRENQGEGDEAQTRQKADLGFYVQGILGVRVAVNPDISLDRITTRQSSIALFRAGHLSFQRTTDEMSWKWFGRILACLVAIAQSVGTTIIFVRRLQHQCMLLADILNFVTAIASVITGISSLLLLFMRFDWEIVRPPSREPSPQREPNSRHDITAMGAQLAIAFFCIGFLRGHMFFWGFI